MYTPPTPLLYVNARIKISPKLPDFGYCARTGNLLTYKSKLLPNGTTEEDCLSGIHLLRGIEKILTTPEAISSRALIHAPYLTRYLAKGIRCNKITPELTWCHTLIIPETLHGAPLTYSQKLTTLRVSYPLPSLVATTLHHYKDLLAQPMPDEIPISTDYTEDFALFRIGIASGAYAEIPKSVLQFLRAHPSLISKLYP